MFDSTVLNPIYEFVVKALVTALLGLAVVGVKYLAEYLRQKLNAKQYETVKKLLATIVRGVAQQFSGVGNDSKLNKAIELAQPALQAAGIKVSDDLLRTWIEAAYHEFKENIYLSLPPIADSVKAGGAGFDTAGTIVAPPKV